MIAVETAIMLPLFIIGILTIGYLLKHCMVSEGVHHAMTDEAHRIMAEAAYIPYPVSFKGELIKRIDSESRGELSNARVDRFTYRGIGVSGGGRIYTDVIKISVSFDTPLKLPRIFLDAVQGERTVYCRAFVGSTQSGDVKPFDEMEKDDGEGTVWIFPRHGERYHEKQCSYIENNPREVLLSKSIRNSYDPCKLCKPGGSRDGTLVYCFETSGRAYHLGSCTTVDRYVIEIGKEDAKTQGYTPCSKCGGG